MRNICIVDECGRFVAGRGLCQTHWFRWRRHGTVELLTFSDRLARNFERSDGCWIWTGYFDRHGYGRIGRDGKTVGAHRAVYEDLVGPIPPGLVIDHLCRTPSCVRPDHMEPVSLAENTRRGLGRTAQTHCKHGHELSGENLIQTVQQRRCRTCRKATSLRYIQKKKAAA